MTEDLKRSAGRPKLNSTLDKELDKTAKQFDEFDSQIKEMTLDRMNIAPKQEVEPQTKIAKSDIEKSKDIYLKPSRSIGSKEKFNERFREEYNFSKEYVHFISEHRECIGEATESWVKPFPGLPAEFWQVPSNTPVWAPRYVADRIRGCKHHRLVMKENVQTGSDPQGNQYFGQMAVDTTIQRIDAYPVSTRKSIFMGSNEFPSSKVS